MDGMPDAAVMAQMIALRKGQIGVDGPRVCAQLPAEQVAGAMMKSVVLPQHREASAKLADLSMEKRDEVAGAMIEKLRSVSSNDRRPFLE